MGFLQSHGSSPAGSWETAESCMDEPHPHGNSSVLPEEASGVPPSLSSRSIRRSYGFALECLKIENKTSNPSAPFPRGLGFCLDVLTGQEEVQVRHQEEFVHGKGCSALPKEVVESPSTE